MECKPDLNQVIVDLCDRAITAREVRDYMRSVDNKLAYSEWTHRWVVLSDVLSMLTGLLSMFIDKGKVISRATGNLAFQYRYTLNIVVTDFPEDPATIYVPLIAWIAVNQPDALLNHDTGNQLIQFEADILNHSTCDLSLKIDLTETVVVTTVDGATSATYTDEPPVDPYHDVSAWEAIYNQPDTDPAFTTPDPTPV